MGNKPTQPVREESRTQLQTAETYSATTISKDQQQQQQQQPPHPRTRSNPSKTGSAGSSASTASGNSSNSKQAAKKKNKLRKNRLPQLKPSHSATPPPNNTGSATPVIQQTTQSVTGSDPNQVNQQPQQSQLVPAETIKKEATVEEQAAGKSVDGKPTRKSKGERKSKNRTTTEDTVTAEKDGTVEKTLESGAPGGNGGLARRKKYKLSGPKPKDENTEFEKIKTKARPARQKKNAQLAGTKNLARMMDTGKTKDEVSLKSFDEEEELVTARLEPTQQISDTIPSTDKTSGDTTTPEKSAEATDKDNQANKRSDYL